MAANAFCTTSSARCWVSTSAWASRTTGRYCLAYSSSNVTTSPTEIIAAAAEGVNSSDDMDTATESRQP
jgi:hypothetical protein